MEFRLSIIPVLVFDALPFGSEMDECPNCGHDLIRVCYVGDDYANIMAEWWVKEFLDDFQDKGGTLK